MNFKPTQRNTDRNIEKAVFDTFFQAEVVFNNDSGRLVIDQFFPIIPRNHPGGFTWKAGRTWEM